MPILLGEGDAGTVTVLPPPPLPPQTQPAPLAPVTAPAPVASFSGPSGASDFGARGLPQAEVGPVGPIVEPHPQPTDTGGGTTPTLTPPGGTGGGVDLPPDHRGLPQPGDTPESVGPIVAPHGAPSPSDAGTTTSDSGGGSSASGGERTLQGVTSTTPRDKTDKRAQAATAWFDFQSFFFHEIPRVCVSLNTARGSIPKVVG